MDTEVSTLTQRYRRYATLALMIATTMQAADATIVNVSLPQIERSLGGGLALGSWVMTSYLCAAAVTAPLTGWLCRRWGRRRVFTWAIGQFVFVSLLCAGAPSPAALVAFRLLQGAAGGFLQPLSQATLLDIYPTRDHGRMQAIWGAAAMAGPVLGPVLGGVITDLASWRLIFLINLPLGAVALSGIRLLPMDQHEGYRERIDGLGLVLIVIGITALQLLLQRGIGRNLLHTPELLGEAAIAAVAAVAVAVHIGRARFTLFSTAVFKDSNFIASNICNFTVSGLVFATTVLLPAMCEGPLRYSAILAGLTVSPRGVTTMVTMVLVGQVVGRIDYRILLASGLVVMASALALISAETVDAGTVWLAGASALQGIGVGVLLSPMSTLAFSSLSAPLRADAAGLYILLRQLGGATGIAAMTAVLQARVHANFRELSHSGHQLFWPPSTLLQAAALHAYGECFRIMAVLALIILPALFLFRIVRAEDGMSDPT